MTTETDAPTPRPVSLVAIASIFVLLSLYWVIAVDVTKNHPAAPQNETPDHATKDIAWKDTPASRRQALADLRKKQAAQGSSYGWVDQKAGVVQLPIARAMELVVQEQGGAK